jgi:uncharacterized damage-inducible protein DinB
MNDTAAAFLRAFDDEMELLRRTLERVPVDRLGWRPHPRARTAGELADHLARIPGWVPGMLAHDGYDLAGDGDPRAPGPAPRSRAELLARLEANRERARTAIAARSEVELAAPWVLTRDGVRRAGMTKHEALRRFVLDHVIHHRGQLTLYLRLLDAPVPALYGSSADERA